VQPNFQDAQQHMEALIAQYAKKHPNADRAGRDTLLARQLLDPGEAVCQIAAFPNGSDMEEVHNSGKLFPSKEPGMWCSLCASSTRSFSSGYVHINSSDPAVHPTIDPAYFKHPLDVDLIARSILHVLSFTELEPLKSILRRDKNGKLVHAKSVGKLPTTLEEAKDYTRNNTSTMYHPVGTCAMLPREKGGVVSDELKVYGTQNVRVIDASIFPTHVQGNPMSLVYAIAEKGADIIKGSITKAKGASGQNGVNGH
jgi:choline dehydrogenase